MTVPVILLQIVKLYGEFCDSSYEKSWVPVQNQWVPFKKQIQNWKCLGLYVTRQLIWRQTQNLCITIYWNFYVNWSTKKANRNIHRYTTAIITATGITRTSGIYVQIDLCVPWDVCHELFYVFGDFSVSQMQAIEVTKSLQYKTYTKNKSSIVELPCSCYYDKPCDYSHHFFLWSHDTSDIPAITGKQ